MVYNKKKTFCPLKSHTLHFFQYDLPTHSLVFQKIKDSCQTLHISSSFSIPVRKRDFYVPYQEWRLAGQWSTTGIVNAEGDLNPLPPLFDIPTSPTISRLSAPLRLLCLANFRLSISCGAVESVRAKEEDWWSLIFKKEGSSRAGGQADWKKKQISFYEALLYALTPRTWTWRFKSGAYERVL